MSLIRSEISKVLLLSIRYDINRVIVSTGTEGLDDRSYCRQNVLKMLRAEVCDFAVFVDTDLFTSLVV